mgnify:CR=1 FL=1
MINWNLPSAEARLITAITRRAEKLSENPMQFDVLGCEMDITACHLNGCALDLERLLKADNFNFAHDVYGIQRHIDRETGKLGDGFLPRYARRTEDA